MFANIPGASALAIKHFSPNAMGTPTAHSLRFDDVQEQACALAGWNQDYLQLSPGRFQGEIHQVHGQGIRLFVEQVQQSVFQTGALADDVLAVGIPLHASGSGMFCGKPCGGDAFHVFSGASGFEFRSSREHTMLGVELKLGKDWLKPLQMPGQACAMTLTPASLQELKTYLLTLFQSAQSQPELLSSARVVDSVADFVLDRMVGADQPSQVRNSTERNSHWALVQQACTQVNANIDQACSVAQLCLDLGVSRRTLQNAFQQVLDVGPLGYLKSVRLGQARRALKRLSSVTEAATSCGFWHFGHFSQDYLAMFGERPSDTLRRSARQ
jgi:AraC family ethanolamine operon transcriptional activator